MKIALAQPILAIGDFSNNKANIINLVNESIKNGAKLVVLPEQTTTVKGAWELLYTPEYFNVANEILDDLKLLSYKIAILVGLVEKTSSGFVNSAVLIQNGSVDKVSCENNLSYAAQRYFLQQNLNKIFEIGDEKFSVVLGSDTPQNTDADWIIALNSTAFVKKHVVQPFSGKKTLFVNHAGLSQESIYNGGSFAADEKGSYMAIAPKLEQALLFVETSTQTFLPESEDCLEEDIFNSLSFAFKEFCRVNRFQKGVIGLSGGIDSALTAVIMCNAIGAQNVLGITMPSKYSTEGSWKDSYELAENLGMECKTVPIKPLFDTFINEIQGKSYNDLAEENLQARLRGNILMSYSNRENRVLVSTGNKSEAAMGYCTLYGDTCGGINLISDLYKQEVYALSRWVNRTREIIPQNTIIKPPSAELRPGQKDQDSLPDYAVLDEILYRAIECGDTIDEISKKFDRELVCGIINKLNLMEFKRNQFTYCLKISEKSLMDRHFPIINAFRV